MNKPRIFMLIMLIALLLRLALILSAGADPLRFFTPDSHEYWSLAGSLLDGQFALQDTPEIFRTPGYPALLAPFRALSPNHGWTAALLLQSILDVGLVFLTFVLALRLTDRITALFAALLQAISPLAIGSSVLVLSDSLFAFLLTATLLCILNFLRSRKIKAVVYAALLISAACYVRPAGIAFATVFAIAILCMTSWRRAALYVGVILLTLSPWVVRNAIVAEYVGFSNFASDSMYRYTVDEIADALDEPRPVANVRTDASPGQRAAARSAVVRRYVAQHPLTFAHVHLRGSLGTCLPAVSDLLETLGIASGEKGTLDVLHRRGPFAAIKHYFGENRLAILLAIPLVSIFVFRLLGVAMLMTFRARRRWIRGEHVLLATLVLTALLIAGPAGHPRFRVPVSPILSIATASGWVALRRRVLPMKADHRDAIEQG